MVCRKGKFCITYYENGPNDNVIVNSYQIHNKTVPKKIHI